MFYEKFAIVASLLLIVAQFSLLFLVVRPYIISYILGDLKWNPKRDRLRLFSHVSLILLVLLALQVVKGVAVPYNTQSKFLIVAVLGLAIILGCFGWLFFSNEEKLLGKPEAKQFQQLFQKKSFKSIILELQKLGILEESGKWIGGPLKNKRDISILMSILIVNGILRTDNYRHACNLACAYFQINFNYEEMTKLIKNYKSEEPEPKDMRSYKLLGFLDNVRC